MTCNGAEVPYDVTQRAYLPSSLTGSLRVEATEENPLKGLCVIVPGIGQTPEKVKVNGADYTEYKAGIHQKYNGPELLLWLPLATTSTVEIVIE